MPASILLAALITAAPPSLTDCRAIAEPEVRLACYDSYVDAALPQASTQSPAAMDPGPPALETRSEAERRAVFETRTEAARSGEAPAIVSKPVEIEADRNGILTITLENGQVWQQASSDRVFRINSKKPPQSASITEAALGSYRLKFDGSRQSLRVRRLR